MLFNHRQKVNNDSGSETINACFVSGLVLHTTAPSKHIHFSPHVIAILANHLHPRSFKENASEDSQATHMLVHLYKHYQQASSDPPPRPPLTSAVVWGRGNTNLEPFLTHRTAATA